MLRTLLVGFLLLFTPAVLAQQGGENCRWISTFDQELVLDSLTVFPESIRFDAANQPVYNFNLQANTIEVSKPTGLDSIRVCYRTLPYDLHTPKANKTLDIYDSTALFKDVVLYQQKLAIPKRVEVVKTEDIAKTGSISRGISFGNRQDVFVNSTLNLQMEGRLSDNMNLRAVITDRNVPFQPEGNTQQLQDFDNVFIELFNDDFSLRAGDVVLQNEPTNFLKYYKNVQGGQLKTSYDMPGGFKASTTVAGSVAKGRFGSVSVEPIEGVQGPYRVRGPNNERFIIILAGSEKVYIDGQLMQRGYDYDYVIDYNLAEITFTNKVLITQFTRIRIDYEFSDQNYSRSIFLLEHEQANEKLNFGVNYYSEKDNRNRPLAFDLSFDEKEILANAGDNLDQAFTSRVDSVAYDENLILYRQTNAQDAQNNVYQIYEYSTNPDSAFYNVQFSEVGSGNGNYVLKNTTANGRVYEWVPPVAGIPSGNYEPVSPLYAPNQKSMFTLNGGYKLSKFDKLDVEVAFSKNDVNLYSDLDSEDDKGMAYKVIYEGKARPIRGLEGYKLNTGLSYEYDDESFSFIDRIRYIEFDRDWSFNAADYTEQFSENILNANVSLQKDRLNGLSYRLVGRKRGIAVDGFQHYINGTKELGRFRLLFDGFYMHNSEPDVTSEWNRSSVDISYSSKYFIPGYRYKVDRNAVTNNATSEVESTAMNFEEHTFYLKNADTLRTTYGVDVQLREDRLPVNGVLLNNTRSNTYNAFFNTQINEANRLSMLFTYRNLEYLDGSAEDDRTIMGRVDWNGSFFKRIIQSDLNYNLANSRELRREFIFIPVPTGQGTHTWRDDNGDGVQDLNEFYLAINPDEKNYAKIFVPTDDFVEAFNTTISYRLNVQFPRNWKEDGGLKKFIQHFSNVTAWSVDSKITDDGLLARLWPTNVSEEDILSAKESLRSTLFFNRTNAKFGADVGFTRLENKQLLYNGFEKNASRDLRSHVRWSFNRGLVLDVNYIQGLKTSISDVLTTRNYTIDVETWQPSITWQLFTTLRFTGTYSLKNKVNVFDEASDEEATLNELGLETRFSKAAKGTISARLKWVEIAFNGEETSPIGYEMLEALRPGSNLTWNLNWQQRLGNGLQLILSYDGRKSGENDAIHLGRVQVSALF
ncbi:hypothetical protein [Roseivirga pacifica]|uniref:hypothetical protein n=1 Tax=Roseivirga pacifica TaxID=1267423 RepID=UPI003BAE236A